MNEEWKILDEYSEDYFVSDLGRVKSFKQDKVDGKILEPGKIKCGYLRVQLYENKKPKTKEIHRLMFEVFIGEIPEGYVVHHIDFNSLNNNFNNFKLMTKAEHQILHMKNISEKTRKLMSENNTGENNPMYGVHRYGEKSVNHKLTEIDVLDIRKSLKYKLYTQKQLSWMYDVSISYISNIKHKRTWKHI